MNQKLKILFSILMITALIFGFIHIYFPAENYSFERLHIFLFNLCTGGTILLYYTQAKTRMVDKSRFTPDGGIAVGHHGASPAVSGTGESFRPIQTILTETA